MTGPEIDLVTRLRNLANWIRLIARTEDRNTCDDAAARVAELEAALEPFASYMDEGGDRDDKGEPLPDDHGVGWVYLTVGDFRRARRVLPEKESRK